MWSEEPTVNNKDTLDTQENTKSLGYPSQENGQANYLLYYTMTNDRLSKICLCYLIPKSKRRSNMSREVVMFL